MNWLSRTTLNGIRSSIWLILLCAISLIGSAQNTLESSASKSDIPFIQPAEGHDQAKSNGELTTPQVAIKTSVPSQDVRDIVESDGFRDASCWVAFDPATWTEFPSNDDGSLGPISLPFTFDLYGDTYSSVYINNNGNLTFDNGYWWYSASGFPITTPMIAPFWSDVDTRTGDGEVWYYVDDNAFYVSWVNVGPYNAYSSYSDGLQNTFQVVLTDGTDPVLAPGNNVGFFYNDMGWTTGSASEGSNGFGGFPATAGVNAGDGINYIQFGLFSQNTEDYDGPDGDEDGVNWLDDSCIEMDVSSATNFPPIAQDFPSDNTLTITEGGSGTVNVGFIGPESNETVTITIDDLGNSGYIVNSNTAGNPANLNMTFSGLTAGTYTYDITGTDNNVSQESTTVTLTVIVEEPDFNCGDDVTVADSDEDCQEDVALTAPTASNLNYGTEFEANYLNMDGSNDYIAVENLFYQGFYDEHSVEAWIRTTDASAGIIASFDRNEFWRLEVNGNGGGNGEIGWSVNTNSGMKDMGSDTRIDDGLWHHVVGVYDNGDMHIYIDGVLDASDSRGTQMGDNTTRYGFIGTGSEASSYNGNRGPNNHFNGDIAGIRVWNRALSLAEITEATCPDPEDVDLLLSYDFTEGTGTTLEDISSYNSNGVLINAFASAWEVGDRPGCFAILNDFNNTTNASDTYPAGETTVTWTLEDPSGVVATCTQLVTVELADPDMICENEYNDYIWNGDVSSDWNTAANWFGGEVPPSGANVMIAMTNFAPEISSTISINNLLIDENSHMDFTSSFGNIKLTGDLAHQGNLDADEGKFTFEGEELQLIKGSSIPTFHDLRINSEDSVRLMVNINLTGAMQPDDGVFDWNDKDVSLLSDADNTGSIGEIKSQAEIIGDEILYQRFFPAGQGNWRMMCSPITDATFAQWNDDFPTTGFTGSDYPNYPSEADPWSNIRVYDETVTTGELHDGFESIDNINDVIGNERGYFVYFIPSPTLVDMMGTFHKGERSFTLTQTVSNTDPYNDGWNLIANPYPSAIDWDDALGWSKSDLDNAIYAFDPINEQYGSYINGISVGQLDNQIASFQAFWVKASGPNPTLTINEKAKVNTGGVFMRSQDMNTQSLVRIRVNTDLENVYDETVLGFHFGALQGFDPTLDAYKFFSGDPALPNLATVPDTVEHHPMSIAMVPVPEEDMVIDLLLRPGQQSELTLKNIMVDSYEGNLCFVLEDKLLETFVPFNLEDEYTFEVTEDMDENRFALHVSAPLDVTVFNESCPGAEDGSIIAQGFGEAPWSFTWFDEMGINIREVEETTTADTFESLAPGFYEILVENEADNCNSATRIVQVEAAPPQEIEADTEVASCNQIADGKISFWASEDYEWDVTITPYGEGEVIEALGFNGDSIITDLPYGIYELSITNNCDNDFDLGTADLRDPNAVSSNFTPDQSAISVNDGGVVFFQNNSSQNATEFKWDFGDGSADSTSYTPQHTYNNWGTYTVSLIAKNAYCADTSYSEIIVTGVGGGNNGTGLQGEQMSELTGEERHNNEFDMIVGPVNIKLTPEEVIEEPVYVNIFNLNGQLVIDQQYPVLPANGLDVNISSLDQGLYTLSVSTAQDLIHSEEFAK